MTLPTNTPVLKVVSITDIGVHIVSLPSGTYQIDGEIVAGLSGFNSYNTVKEVSVKNIHDIRLITTQKVIKHYENSAGAVITTGVYGATNAKLLSNAYRDSDEYEYEFEKLEDEFEYRKLKQSWMPVYETITTVSEPLRVDLTEIKQDTGNPHIVAGYLTGAANTPLYSYSRTNAMRSLLEAKFSSLGMEKATVSNYAQTEGKRIWANSHAGTLEFVIAFGKYIIGKHILPKTRGEFKGSLEYLEEVYNEDKRWLDDHIQTLYNLHFRNENASGVLLSEVHKGVKDAITYVSTLDVKVKSETSKRGVLNKLNSLMELVNEEVLQK